MKISSCGLSTEKQIYERYSLTGGIPHAPVSIRVPEEIENREYGFESDSSFLIQM